MSGPSQPGSPNAIELQTDQKPEPTSPGSPSRRNRGTVQCKGGAHRALWSPDADHLARRPFCCCGASVFLMLLLSMVGLNGFAMNTTRPGRSPYNIRGSYATERFDAHIFAKRSVKDEVRPEDQVLADEANFLILEYYLEEGSVFQCEHLEEMYRIEQAILAADDFDTVCKRDFVDGAWQCSGWMSPTNVLAPGGECVDDIRATLAAYTLPAPDERNAIMDAYHDTSLTGDARTDADEEFAGLAQVMQFYFHVDRDYGPSSPKSRMTRSVLSFGRPLKGYDGPKDRDFEQEQKIGKWSVGVVDTIIKPAQEKNDVLMIGYIGGPMVMTQLFDGIVAGDGLFAMFSMLLVFCYSTYHTKSFFVSSAAMFHIIMSFPLTIFVTQKVFMIVFFDYLNVFVIYLLIGVGCDNVYVIFDAFAQSKLMDSEQLGAPGAKGDDRMAARMRYTLGRARPAMMATAATTTGAFFANLVSQLMPVSQFGVFAGTAISVNFFLVSTYFASVLVIHERYLAGEKCCRCRRRYNKAEDPTPAGGAAQSEPVERKMDVWYLEKVSVVLTQHAWKFIAVFLLLGIGGASSAAQIKQASETPLFLPEDHPVQMMLSRIQCDDPEGLCYSQETTTDERQVYVMMWGVEPAVDRQDTSRFDDLSAECDFEACGTHTLDGSFDLAEPAAQKHVKDTCERGAKLAWVNLETVSSCIMMDFERWLVQRNLDFPVPKSEFMPRMREFLSGPVEKASFVDGRKIKIVGDRVEWVTVEWQSQYQVGQFYAASYVEPGFEEWQQFEVDTNKRGPASAKHAFGTTSANSGVFMMYETSNEFSASVFRCGAISASVAFIVLLCATQNIYVALIAKLNIITITASTVGAMYLYGWEMGVLESVCVVLVFGFAVDYTVHFCISYTERRPEDDGKYDLGSTRVDRVRHAFFELGASVLGGGTTSFLAACVLFFCTAQFFKIFGIFICTVVVLSELYAHMFFMPLLSVLGPEGTQGDLRRFGTGKAEAPAATENGANGAHANGANGAQSAANGANGANGAESAANGANGANGAGDP